uniref:Glutaredoxin-2, mitochondrial n=1 Tax=Meleagris gallopavo TaxID=9103 RepID=A0A803Y8L0_MELGA
MDGGHRQSAGQPRVLRGGTERRRGLRAVPDRREDCVGAPPLPGGRHVPAEGAALAGPEVISDNCVVIFSKTTCFYCKMAKKLFEGLNVNYTAVELDVNKNGSQFQDILEQMTGGRTVPRVFVNGTFVGGATDTQRLHEEGKLLPLIHQCQVKTNSGTTI